MNTYTQALDYNPYRCQSWAQHQKKFCVENGRPRKNISYYAVSVINMTELEVIVTDGTEQSESCGFQSPQMAYTIPMP